MFRRLSFVAVMAALQISSVFAAAAPKTIGFMGVLNSSTGAHQNGPVTLVLSLYTTPSGGSVLWSEVQTVTVTNGLFTTQLGAFQPLDAVDFSQSYFVGIRVMGENQEMAPRIPLQGVPYALFAHSVANGSVNSDKLVSDSKSMNKVSGGVVSVSGANVGIGTTTPERPLDIRGPQRLAARIEATSTTGTWLSLSNTTGAGAVWHMIATGSENGEGAGKMLFSPGSVDTTGPLNLVLDSTGNVGIGTDTPNARLDVKGEVRLGNNSQYAPVTGSQPLHSVYGYYRVGDGGALLSGSGVAVNRTNVGTYRVDFTTPFSNFPAVSITPVGTQLYTVFITDLTPAGVAFKTFSNGTPAEVQWFSIMALGPR